MAKALNVRGITAKYSVNQPLLLDSVPARTNQKKDLKFLRTLKVNDHMLIVPPNIELVDSPTKLKQCAEDIAEAKIMTFDCETNGLSWFRNYAVALSIYTPIGTSYFIPTRMVHAYRNFEVEELHEALFDVLTSLKIEKIGHNAKFDMHFMRRTYNIEIPPESVIHDTALAQWALDENSDHDLEAICTDYDIAPAWKSKQDGSFEVWPLKTATAYSGRDAVNTYKVYEFQIPHLEARPGLKSVLYDEDMPNMRIMYAAERRGIGWDPTYFETTAKPEIQTAMRDAEKVCKSQLGMLNLAAPAQLASALYDGYGVPRLLDRKGDPINSTNKETLNRLKADYPIIGDIQTWKKFDTVNKMFITKLPNFINNGRIHANFSIVGTVTGRMSCIAKGSFVDMPRNLLTHPLGIPIEQVKEGDLVYSFDSAGVPKPKRVLKTIRQGTKRVLRLVYRAAGAKSYLGELRATPDHRIRLLDGSYKRLDALVPGEKLAFLSRVVSGLPNQYATLSWCSGKRVDEHVHLRPGHQTVHHKNEIKLDNRVENLVGMTRAEHSKQHEDRLPRTTKKCPYTKLELLDILQHGIKIAAATTNHDFATLRRWSNEFQISIKTYPYVCPFSDDELIDANQTRGLSKLARIANVSNFTVQKWRDVAFARSAHATNHSVVAVIDDGEEVETYDLSIADSPNFIVNEIGVHNCKEPNLQQIPKSSVGPVIRRAFIPSSGCEFVTFDYSQIELRLLAHESEDETLIDAFMRDLDIHSAVCNNVFKIPYDECATHPKRTIAKNINFGIPYGIGAAKLASFILDTQENAQSYIDMYFGTYPGVQRYIDKCHNEAYWNGYIETMFGRKRRLPDAKSLDRMKAANASRQAQNAPIQMAAGGLIKRATVVHDEILRQNGWPFELILQIHDELVYEVNSAWLRQNMKVLDVLENAMCSVVTLRVPVKTSCERLSRWGDKVVSEDALMREQLEEAVEA